jgi:hypothetical protein
MDIFQIYIVIFFIIIIYIITFDNDIRYYDFGNIHSKYKICFIAGTHGNEPAGSITLLELIKNNYFTNNNVFIRVIPIVNNFGYKFGIRYQNNILHPDINRNFLNNGLCKVSKKLINLTHDFDLIIDFHEGWSFHKINNSSIGSTLTATEKSFNLAENIINEINKTIIKNEYKFILRRNICDISSTFGCYRKNIGKEYILVETTGQNNIQPLNLRKQQIKIVIDNIIKNYI